MIIILTLLQHSIERMQLKPIVVHDDATLRQVSKAAAANYIDQNFNKIDMFLCVGPTYDDNDERSELIKIVRSEVPLHCTTATFHPINDYEDIIPTHHRP